MHPRKQGDLGEASAIEWLTRQGAIVSKPLFHSPDYDLVADFGDRICRIEVKTCTRRSRGNWCVQLCTHGGNQSWSGTTKFFEPSRCDFVFVQVGDGRRWFIPTEAIETARSITVGGPKYSEYEVPPGEPILVRTS